MRALGLQRRDGERPNTDVARAIIIDRAVPHLLAVHEQQHAVQLDRSET
jgi:hypothetical protein